MVVSIYQAAEWLDDGNFNKPKERAVSCLEHLINCNYSGQNVNVVEVGPISTVALDLISMDIIQEMPEAPISSLHERNPNINCISIGCHKVTASQQKEALGNVAYVLGMLSPDFIDDERLLQVMNGKPQIIYGGHVFENSPGGHKSLPLGPYKPFEKSAEILDKGGFIVIDNADGLRKSVAIMEHWKFSSQMVLHSSYMYSSNQGIYVFQKK